MAYKTLEEWYYKYRNDGFEALKPRPRKDRNRSRVLAEDLQQLVLDMKREDPGRSAHVILRELELAGRIRAGQASVSSVQRLLQRHGLSIPRMEWDHAARYRWEAAMCGELWQADALHGPMLMNPATGRNQRVIVFGLIDDRSRLIPYLEGGLAKPNTVSSPSFIKPWPGVALCGNSCWTIMPASAATICACYAPSSGFT